MARKQGFIPNRKNIGRILREDPGVAAALNAIADPVASRSGGTKREYVTDRQVVAVEVDAEAQAVDGVTTRALGEQGLTLS